MAQGGEAWFGLWNADTPLQQSRQGLLQTQPSFDPEITRSACQPCKWLHLQPVAAFQIPAERQSNLSTGASWNTALAQLRE